MINADYPGGRHYDGAGVSISLADDGEVGPHIDFQGRLTNLLTTGAGGTHGDMTSGIAAGAGNLDQPNVEWVPVHTCMCMMWVPVRMVMIMCITHHCILHNMVL